MFSTKCPESLELTRKSAEFEIYIRELQMIKFYSESVSDEDKLTLLTIKSGLLLLQN